MHCLIILKKIEFCCQQLITHFINKNVSHHIITKTLLLKLGLSLKVIAVILIFV